MPAPSQNWFTVVPDSIHVVTLHNAAGQPLAYSVVSSTEVDEARDALQADAERGDFVSVTRIGV